MDARQPTVLKARTLKVTQQKCPPGKVCAAVMRYQIEATYKTIGCADTLEVKPFDGGYTADGKRVIELMALNYHSAKTVKCIQHAPKKVVIPIGTQRNVVIVELEDLSDLDTRQE